MHRGLSGALVCSSSERETCTDTQSNTAAVDEGGGRGSSFKGVVARSVFSAVRERCEGCPVELWCCSEVSVWFDARGRAVRVVTRSERGPHSVRRSLEAHQGRAAHLRSASQTTNAGGEGSRSKKSDEKSDVVVGRRRADRRSITSGLECLRPGPASSAQEKIGHRHVSRRTGREEC